MQQFPFFWPDVVVKLVQASKVGLEEGVTVFNLGRKYVTLSANYMVLQYLKMAVNNIEA